VITARAWAGKRFLVYGLARSGLACVQALLASGAEVLAWDDDPARVRALGNGVSGRDALFVDDFTDWQEIEAEALVLSPGVPLNTHPLARNARAIGLPIIGDIELFARARPELPPHKVVGITGTNGKSTTTALVHHILRTAGVPTTMGGNIGLPILAQEPLPEGGVYVLELSSFQIDLTQSLDCDVAVLLNITPDHLDRYESFEAYAAAKARLFAMQSESHYGLIGTSTAAAEAVFQDFPRTCLIALEPWLPRLDQYPALSGHHNLENVAAASYVCSSVAIGLAQDEIEQGLQTYPGLPHRMERVREKDGVLFVNDSKATNPEAAAPALAAYPRVRWIVGGQAKSENLGHTAKHLDHVVHAYTIGEAGPMFAHLLREAGAAVTDCETLENAVNRAAADSQAGDVVLLSPACASFDQFRDFEARGDAFRRQVGDL
jgi:UDP-N-acetylmuramoylalanine--D-glutamate ligase